MSGSRPLPVVISVPHGGRETPPEVEGLTRLTARDIFDDGDALTDRIYDVHGHVAHCQIATVARAFVDLNRAPDDRAPGNPDGAVKSVTAYGEPVWIPARGPGDALAETLLARYHAPYHRQLEIACAEGEGDLVCGIDCHSMAALAPPTAVDPGAERPLLCLSNADGATAPRELLGLLGDAIAESFGLSRDEVLANEPFKGGWTVRRHGRRPLPWVQLEMNRALYLADPWFDAEHLVVSERRLEDLNRAFLDALGRFVGTA